jgi:ribokinase
MSGACVISLGSINLDLQARADSWPQAGKLSTLQDFLVVVGGKAANVAYFVKRLGVPAMLIARTGDDALAPPARALLEQIGVDLRFTRALSDAHTGVAMILVGRDADKAIALAANANDAWSREDAEDAATAVRLAPSGSVLACDLEISAEALARAIDAARERGFPVVLDPSPAQRFDAAQWRGVDYLTPNPGEAETLTGVVVRGPEDGFRAGKLLQDRGVRNVLVKLREGGCAVMGEAESFLVEAPHVTPVDKTGAGDAFAGAVAVAVGRGLPLREVARMAVAAATIAVTRYGSQASYPDRAELEKWIALVREPRAAG